MSGAKICKQLAPNFETLKRAFVNGDVALMECQRISDDVIVAMLCAVGFDGENYTFTPFAEMVNGDPFEMYLPPNPDGGFFNDRKGEPV